MLVHLEDVVTGGGESPGEFLSFHFPGLVESFTGCEDGSGSVVLVDGVDGVIELIGDWWLAMCWKEFELLVGRGFQTEVHDAALAVFDGGVEEQWDQRGDGGGYG